MQRYMLRLITYYPALKANKVYSSRRQCQVTQVLHKMRFVMTHILYKSFEDQDAAENYMKCWINGVHKKHPRVSIEARLDRVGEDRNFILKENQYDFIKLPPQRV